MRPGAARKRASRQRERQAALITSQAVICGSSTPSAPSFDPAFRAQSLQGWNSFPTQDQSFTLNQEACNTHKSIWNDPNRLRNNAIQFVSGGNLSQDNPSRDEESEEIEIEHVKSVIEERENVSWTGSEEIKNETYLQSEDEAVGIRSSEVGLVITKQVKQLDLFIRNHNSSSTLERSTPTSSTSSSEVILFAGRDNLQKKRKQSSTPSITQPGTPASSKSEHVYKNLSSIPLSVNTPSRSKLKAVEFVPVQITNSASRYPLRSQNLVTPGWIKRRNGSANPAAQQNSNGLSRPSHRRLLDNYDNEQEILWDYVESVKKNQKSDGSGRRCNYKESGLDNGEEASVIASTAHLKVHRTGPDNDRSSDDLRDFDALDTSVILMAPKPPQSKLALRIWQSVRRASTIKTKKVPIVKMDTISTSLCASSVRRRTSSTPVCILPDRNTSCTTLTSPALSLPNLPPELHLMLFDCLDYESLLKLGATGKYFRCMIRREHVVAALYRDEDVIVDRSSIRKERLACFRCYRLRSAFFDFDERGIQPKYVVEGEEAGRRRCLIFLMPSSPMQKVSDARSGNLCSGAPDDVQSDRHRGLPA